MQEPRGLVEQGLDFFEDCFIEEKEAKKTGPAMTLTVVAAGLLVFVMEK